MYICVRVPLHLGNELIQHYLFYTICVHMHLHTLEIAISATTTHIMCTRTSVGHWSVLLSGCRYLSLCLFRLLQLLWDLLSCHLWDIEGLHQFLVIKDVSFRVEELLQNLIFYFLQFILGIVDLHNKSVSLLLEVRSLQSHHVTGGTQADQHNTAINTQCVCTYVRILICTMIVWVLTYIGVYILFYLPHTTVCMHILDLIQ